MDLDILAPSTLCLYAHAKQFECFSSSFLPAPSTWHQVRDIVPHRVADRLSGLTSCYAMSTILDIPNELTLRIISMIHPSDLEAFAIINKSVHALAKDALRRHLAFKKRYSYLRFGFLEDEYGIVQAQRSNDSNHALLLLASILENPDVAYYPRRIRIGCCEDAIDILEDMEDDILLERQSVIAKHSVQLKGMVDECTFVYDDQKAEMTDSLRQPGNESAAIILLMTLLPSLHYVNLWSWSISPAKDKLFEIVRQIADANRDPASCNYRKCLSQLWEFRMDHLDTQFGEKFEDYVPLAMLPSMRCLRGNMICSEGLHWRFNLSPRSSTVTDLFLEYSAISANAFEKLFAGIATLKRFSYDHGGATVGFVNYEPVAIINALCKHASDSLEALDIEARHYEPDEDDEGLLDCLRLFTRLKSIRLADNLFTGPEDLESVETPVEGELDERTKTNTSYTTARLVDLLPASVKGLTLIQLMDDEDMRDLLDGMAEQKAAKLPSLKRLTFECEDPLEKDMRTSLQAAGIKLWSWKTRI